MGRKGRRFERLGGSLSTLFPLEGNGNDIEDRRCRGRSAGLIVKRRVRSLIRLIYRIVNQKALHDNLKQLFVYDITDTGM